MALLPLGAGCGGRAAVRDLRARLPEEHVAACDVHARRKHPRGRVEDENAPCAAAAASEGLGVRSGNRKHRSPPPPSMPLGGQRHIGAPGGHRAPYPESRGHTHADGQGWAGVEQRLAPAGGGRPWPPLGLPAALAALCGCLRWNRPSAWSRAADRAAQAALLCRAAGRAPEGAPRADLGVAFVVYAALLTDPGGGGRLLHHLFHHQVFMTLAAVAGWPPRLLLAALGPLLGGGRRAPDGWLSLRPRSCCAG